MKKTNPVSKRIKKKQQTEYRFKSNDVSVWPNKVVTCERLNIYFHRWGPTLANNIPKPSRTPDFYLCSDLANSMFQVSKKEIGCIIYGLPHSTRGHIDLTAEALGSCLSSLHPNHSSFLNCPYPGLNFNWQKKIIMSHLCYSLMTWWRIYTSMNWVIIGSGNGLSPVREAITWTNAGILSIGVLGTNFNQIWIEILSFSFKKIHLKMSSAKLAAILSRWVNSLRPRQNGRRFADDTCKRIFFYENARISLKISLKFVPKVRINIIPALVQIMAWRRPGDKPLSEPMMVSLLTHICVTRPQWVNNTLHVFKPYSCIR